jgi:hypothetical protein
MRLKSAKLFSSKTFGQKNNGIIINTTKSRCTIKWLISVVLCGILRVIQLTQAIRRGSWSAGECLGTAERNVGQLRVLV